MNKSITVTIWMFVFLLLPFTSIAETTEERSASVLSSVRESTEETAEVSARRWGLTVNEWQRYEEIMKGEGRYNWKDKDPIMVLGLYAETDAERERYAERLAVQEHALVDRLTKLNFAYLRAFQRLYGDEPLLDLDKFYAFYNMTPPSRNDQIKPGLGSTLGDRFVLFISPDCNGCDASYLNLRRVQEFGTALDIYFVGASDQDIMDWAKTMDIDPDLVKSRSVTLNDDTGMYARYNRPPLPAAFYYSKSTESVHPVNLDTGAVQ
ncbi:MAG: TIGR03759 family integrating conjugative element protein [Gammaproteobacteria bacterium]|nr:TIGR03759 family integrating conjugative element protein [Gammaproteobacteria bacterium]